MAPSSILAAAMLALVALSARVQTSEAAAGAANATARDEASCLAELDRRTVGLSFSAELTKWLQELDVTEQEWSNDLYDVSGERMLAQGFPYDACLAFAYQSRDIEHELDCVFNIDFDYGAARELVERNPNVMVYIRGKNACLTAVIAYNQAQESQ